MGEVLKFRGKTSVYIDPDVILEQAKERLDEVFIMGFDKDGNHYFASSSADGGDLLWLMETFKTMLMSGELQDE